MEDAHEGEEDCYCTEESKTPAKQLSKCGHFVHFECLESWWGVNVSAAAIRCPVCGRSAFKQVAVAKVSPKKVAVKTEVAMTRSKADALEKEKAKAASKQATPVSNASTTNMSKASSTNK